MSTDVQNLEYTDELVEYLREKLVGRRIVKAQDDRLALDDGQIVVVQPNEGCGGCGHGWAEIDFSVLTNTESAVMNVELATNPSDDEIFQLFIYYVDQSCQVVDGDLGHDNGYYGQGFWVSLKELTDDSQVTNLQGHT